jgi:hypothetical protein
MKRPYENIKQIFFENLDKVKENQRFNYKFLDKYMIWVVGFSITGLGIIVTNLTGFSTAFDHCVLKIILILLSTSIISGIIYRLAFYFWQVQYQAIEFFLQGAFSDNEIMETYPDDLEDENDIKEVVRRIKNDFGEDVSHMLPLYDQGPPDIQQLILDDLKDHYKKTGEWAKRDFEFGMNYVKSIYKTAFGFSQKRIDKIFTEQTPTKLKIYGWITLISFLLCCLSFIAVIIILCAAYQ